MKSLSIIGALQKALVIALALAVSPAFPADKPQRPGRTVVIDRIVAVVNDEAITARELDERTQFAMKQLAQQGTAPPPRAVVERQLLERLVADRAQLQFAKETGLRVDDAELDRAIGRIAEQNKLTVPQLRETLERDGVAFAKFREDIRSEIVMTRLREREVDNRIVVTESEIDALLASASSGTMQSDEVNLSHILVVVPENARPEQVQARRARAEEARAQLEKGADFRQVAAAFSEAPDALQGGLMGWRAGERLPTLFYDALKSMKPGDVSEILRSANGFHILRLNERRAHHARRRAASVQRATDARAAHSAEDERARFGERSAQPAPHAEGAAGKQGRFRGARPRAFRRCERGARAATSAGSCPETPCPSSSAR